MTPEESKVQDSVEHLRVLSKVIFQCYHDHDALVQQLNQLNPANRQTLWTTYQNATGPVVGIRNKVAEILKDRDITKAELQTIIDDAKIENPKSYSRMYKEWYNLLYIFVLTNYKDDANLAIETIRKLVQDILGNPTYLKSVKFDFSGERETGSTQLWIAFFNTRHSKQDTAKQLFLSIENGSVYFSLYNRPLKKHIVEIKKQDGDPFDIEEMNGLFRKYLPDIEKDIDLSINQITLNSNENIFKISMGPNDIDEQGYQYLLSDNLVMVNKDTSPIGKSLERQGDVFTQKMKIGDYFYLCRGNKMILIGKITGDSEAVEYESWGDEGWAQRSFIIISESVKEYKYKGEQKWWTPNFRSTCWQINNDELEMANEKLFSPFFQTIFLKPIQEDSKEDKKISNNNMNKVLNTILYGPPGTGKTYNTIEKAIRLANPAYVFPNTGDKVKERQEVKKEFDRLKKLGQVYFTTFHQSLSYEDFIEGIKPLPPVAGQSVQYDVVPGLFKQACAMAAHNCYNEYIKSNKSDTDYTFDDLYDAFITDVESLLEKNTPPVYKTIQGRDVEIKEINKNDSIIARAKDSIAKQSAPLTKENIQKLYDRFETIEEIKGLDEVRDTVQITPRITEFYAVFRGLKDFEKTFKPNTEFIKEVNVSENFDVDEIQKKFDGGVYNEAMKTFGQKALPVVFVIDEINRGNVSQIFGELITLIEDDKRAGRQEALDAKLPYSKKYFSVPANLYIVGTMNTADRSVEALDTALRRRFAFEEKMPEPKLLTGSVKDISLESLLIKINERVELLLDRDHTIGHSYLITVKDDVDLKLAFKNKILPLLQEYFYGDYGKIGLVLGTGFVIDNVKLNKTPFAPFKYPNGNEQFISQKCELIPINEDFKIIEAVKTLMSN
jgi:hypothetical protein